MVGFVNPNILAQIFGAGAQQSQPGQPVDYGALQQQQKLQMLAAAGAGIANASVGQNRTPGFAEALAGGAQALSDPALLQQQAALQQASRQQHQDFERRKRIGQILRGDRDFTSEVQTQLPQGQTPSLTQPTSTGASVTPVAGRQPMVEQSFGATPLSALPPDLRPPQQVDAILQQAAQKNGVPVDMLRVLAAQESSFNPSAYNQPTAGDPTDPGATGLFQFTDATARGMGIDPTDPAQAADATARMLRQAMENGADPITAMTQHFGGPDPALHGPKTAQYRQDITEKLRRISGAGQSGAPQVVDPGAPQQSAVSPGFPQQGGNALGIPEGLANVLANVLAALGPDQAAPVIAKIAQQQAAAGQPTAFGDLPADVQKALFAFGGDREAAMGAVRQGMQPEPSSSEAEIQRFLEANPGTTRAQAIQAVDSNRYMYRDDPLQGTIKIDTLTGEVEPQRPSFGTVEFDEGRDVPSIDQIDPAQALGLPGALRNVGNVVAGFFNRDELPSQEAERARALLNRLATEGTTAFAASVPGRPSNLQLEMGEQLQVRPGQATVSAARAREIFDSTITSTKSELDRINNDILSNPQGYTNTQLAQARANASRLRAFLGKTVAVRGALDTDGGNGSTGQAPAPRQGGSGPSLVPRGQRAQPGRGDVPANLPAEAAELWEFMTPEEKAAWQ